MYRLASSSSFSSSHTTLLHNKLSPFLLRRNRRHQSQRLHRRNYQVRAMRAVIQRVSSSSVTVDGRIVSEIGPGLLVLIGIHESDTDCDADYICRKVLNMRLFSNETTGKGWDQNVMQRNYGVLLVSQFTLYGFLKGNKPDFHVAMPPDKAKSFYASLVEKFQKVYNPDAVKDGVFGAMMQVNLVNDGPVTMQLESPQSSKSETKASTES
ncbi:D-aminoacyl-tRNA deacylase DTD [Arabidopsis suecica]|uniref:D-aminoacyl-tRNA deacylase n=1 Tax=Arabidopsis suecica TaxID=45249 RepID=A0A8T1YLB9_ARASU|nr:D-aminoacyl-tRNA deacylase DTD [Arabidopsis suecica]